MNKNILNGLTGTLLAVALAACAPGTASGQTATINRMVVLGDSILWGQGLLDGDKIHSRVRNMLENCLGHGPINVTNVAHSGATIGVDDARPGIPLHGEIPTAYPTILKQCADFDNAPESVDLVLLDGGANDVNSPEGSVPGIDIVDPRVSFEEIMRRTEQHCHHSMTNLLEQVSAKFTRATIVVSGYYPIVSEETPIESLLGILTRLGISVSPISNGVRDAMVAKSRLWGEKSAEQLRLAVDEANAVNRSLDRTNRIVFADPRFGPENAMLASQHWVFTWKEVPPPLFYAPEDPVASNRVEECRAIFHLIPCDWASMGHPNPTGAQAYADAIFAAYLNTDGLVRWNGGSGEWHTAANWTPNRVPGSDDTVLITNGTVEVNSPATAGHVIVKGGTLTHRRGVAGGLQLTVIGTLRVEAGGRIDVSSRGLRGSYQDGNVVPSTGGYYYGEGYDTDGVPLPIIANGASHGTLGGNSSPVGGGVQPLYGSPTDPVLFGSGGFSAAGGAVGGNGGGLVRVTAQDIVLDGAIKADGGNASVNGGGGSGGSVNMLLTGGTFSGAGIITVTGGTGTSGRPNAGHGRIAIRGIGTNQFAGTHGSAGSVFEQVINTGGALILDNTTLVIATDASLTIDTFQTRPNGAATVINRGTLILGTNHLTVPSGLTLFQDGLVQGANHAAGVVGVVTVRTNGVLTHTRGQTNGIRLIVSGTLRVEAGGRIDVSSRGLRGSYQDGNVVPSTGGYYYGEGYDTDGVPLPIIANGASHGTLGGNSSPVGGGVQPLYGSPTDPVLFGSGGFSAAGGAVGGNGGGLVRVTAQDIVLDGAIKADGGNASVNGGGGSGGSVNMLLTGGTFSGAGIITVTGGTGTSGRPNAGHGRIAIRGIGTNQFAGTHGSAGSVFEQVINTGGALILDNTTLVIATDASLTIDTFQTRPNGAATVINRGTLILGTNHLTVPSGLTLFQDGLVQGANHAAGVVGVVTVRTNGVLTHTRGQTNGIRLIVSGTLRVEAGGRIDVSSRGLRGSYQDGNVVPSTGGYYYGEGYDTDGVPLPIIANGASHGTLGGNSSPVGGGVQPLYGSPTDPVLFGSGGFSAAGGAVGGNGGGLVRVTAQDIVLDGAIKADGGNASVNGGGGSGGSVNMLLTGGTFSGAGIITVTGGTGTSGRPNGGCGRIAVVGHATNAFTGTFSCGTVYFNARPVLPTQGDRTMDELTLLTVNNAALDADLANTLSYTFLAAPGSAGVFSGGLISWTPSEAAGPSTNIITVVVSDNALRPLTATNTFTVIVGEVNSAPVLALPANTSVNELAPFSAQATATDSDIPLNTLSFALVSGPAGLTVSSEGVITWTPTEAQGPGTHIVTLRVTDLNPPAVNATSLSVTSSFQIVVNEVNTAPVLTVRSEQTVSATALLSVNATATDADLPANTLTFDLVSGPSGLSVSASGLITWTPGDAQAGTTNAVTLSVTDNGLPRLSATQMFTITVAPRPILSIRPDGTDAVISWQGAVTGFTLEYTTELGSGVWTTELTPVVDTATEHTVTVPASSGRRFYRLKK